MARLELGTSSTLWSQETKDSIYGDTTASWNGSYESKRFQRSDIVVNPDDGTGWREPSPYFADDAVCVPARGVFFYSPPDTSSGGQPRKITIRGSGTFYNAAYMHPNILPGTDLGVNAENQCITKALEKLKDVKVNAALAAVEMRRSVALVRDSALTLLRAARAVKGGSIKKAAGILGVAPTKRAGATKGFAQNWLALQYGWLPLLSDMHGAYEELTREDLLDGAIVNVRARRVSEPDGYMPPANIAVGNSVFSFDVKRHWYSKNEMKVSLFYRLSLPGLRRAASLGLTNPASVAWELVPFSFLSDWFIPIGQVLDALDADVGLTFLGGTCTDYSLTTCELIGTPQQQYTTGYCHGTFKRMRMFRKVYPNSPRPAPYVKNPLSVAHAANAVALLRANLPR